MLTRVWDVVSEFMGPEGNDTLPTTAALKAIIVDTVAARRLP